MFEQGLIHREGTHLHFDLQWFSHSATCLCSTCDGSQAFSFRDPLILFCALEFGAVWGGALALDVGFVGWLCFGVALWIVELVLGCALCFGLFLGFRRQIGAVLCVLWFWKG